MFQIVDAKFSVSGIKALGEKEYEGDSKAIGVLNEIIHECETITDADLCEQSAKLADCMIKSGLKRGIDPKKGIRESLASN